MAAWQLIVTAAASVDGVARRAGLAVDRRVLAVDIVLPPRGVADWLHHLMAGRTLRFRRCRGNDVLMAHEALGSRLHRFTLVICTEAVGVKRRFDVARMTRGCGPSDLIDVTRLAIRHTEIRSDCSRGIVALHTIDHLGQGQVGEALAGRNRVVATGAIETELILRLEMRYVRKLDVDVLTGDDMVGDHPAFPGKSRVFDLFRRMTIPAIFGGRVRRQHGLGASL